MFWRSTPNSKHELIVVALLWLIRLHQFESRCPASVRVRMCNGRTAPFARASKLFQPKCVMRRQHILLANRKNQQSVQQPWWIDSTRLVTWNTTRTLLDARTFLSDHGCVIPLKVRVQKRDNGRNNVVLKYLQKVSLDKYSMIVEIEF
jgi:hypothetical protein